ncbi:hypothetical protein K439DRAFT_1620553 [Ramaria rubella]|nr:hypothetical protein K439DRAFT_1620553 [Ramaria rubella]
MSVSSGALSGFTSARSRGLYIMMAALSCQLYNVQLKHSNTLKHAQRTHCLFFESTPAQTATLPLCFVTAAQALHLHLKLPVTTGSSSNDRIIIAINGLAKLTGFKVIRTTSNANLEFVSSLGAGMTVSEPMHL